MTTIIKHPSETKAHRTLVAAAHEPQCSSTNGVGGCHARAGNNGQCPGYETAAWLNSLGDDDARFGNTTHTNGEVRGNYLRGTQHIVALHPVLAELQMRRITLRKELSAVNASIHRLSRDALTHDDKATT